MTREKDGGSAFPAAAATSGHFEIDYGMSLRDYFAGQFLNGVTADPESHELFDNMMEVAENAYEMADAMIAARKETQ